MKICDVDTVVRVKLLQLFDQIKLHSRTSRIMTMCTYMSTADHKHLHKMPLDVTQMANPKIFGKHYANMWNCHQFKAQHQNLLNIWLMCIPLHCSKAFNISVPTKWENICNQRSCSKMENTQTEREALVYKDRDTDTPASKTIMAWDRFDNINSSVKLFTISTHRII